MIPNSTLSVAVAHLEHLVAFDTVSSRSNLGLIDWTADVLDGAGARLRRTASDDGAKCNLLASFGPDAPGGIVLSGHTDVVPVEGQDWTTDPFRLTRSGDRLLGRGAADMKGFIACCLAVLTSADALRLHRPVHLALSYDEEVGCLGAPRMVDDLAANGTLPALALVGEPTLMRIATAHKSANLFDTCFTGLEAHSSRSNLGVSALVHAADYITWLRDRFADGEAHRSTVAGLDPPWSTFNIGTLNGGTAVNIIPREARMVWEYRGIPELDTDAETAALLEYLESVTAPRMRRLHPGAGVSTTRLACVPALDPRGNRAARDALRAIAGVDGDEAVSFGTEAGIFQRAGIPAVVCGPGSIDVAHKPDEYVEAAQLDAATTMLERVLAWAATNDE